LNPFGFWPSLDEIIRVSFEEVSKKLRLNLNDEKTREIDFASRARISSVESGTHGMTKSRNQKTSSATSNRAKKLSFRKNLRDF
jgi:hypothetical protein